MMNIYRKNQKTAEEETMRVAADGLVHFTEGASGLTKEAADDDGFNQLQIARTVYFCMAC